MPAEEASKPPGSVHEAGGTVELSSATRTGNSLASLRRLSRPARYSLHQLKTRLALTPCGRATRATDAPSANASPTIRCFSSSVRYCRLVGTGCVCKCPSSLHVDTIVAVHIASMTCDYTLVQTVRGGQRRTLTILGATEILLFVSQRHHGINLGGTVSGNVARQESDDSQYQGNYAECEWIVRPHAE